MHFSNLGFSLFFLLFFFFSEAHVVDNAPVNDRLDDDISKPANRERHASVNTRIDRIASVSSNGNNRNATEDVDGNATEDDDNDVTIAVKSEGLSL
jgi:hypothetical protein